MHTPHWQSQYHPWKSSKRQLSKEEFARAIARLNHLRKLNVFSDEREVLARLVKQYTRTN